MSGYFYEVPKLTTSIDLFTDTVAMLNVLVLRLLWDAEGALTQYLRGQKENFTVYFSGKRRSLLHPNTAQQSFFSHYNLFLGKLEEKLARKARVNTKRASRIKSKYTAIARKVVGESARDNPERYCASVLSSLFFKEI